MSVDFFAWGFMAVCAFYAIYTIVRRLVPPRYLLPFEKYLHFGGKYEPLIEVGIFLGKVRRVALFVIGGGYVPTHVAEYPGAKVSGLRHALMYVNNSFVTAEAIREQGLDGEWFTVTYCAQGGARTSRVTEDTHVSRDTRAPPLVVSVRMVWREDGNHTWEFPFGHKKACGGDATLKGLWSASGYQEMLSRANLDISE